MSQPRIFDIDHLVEAMMASPHFVKEGRDQLESSLRSFAERGRGFAVYRNEELGHPWQGTLHIETWGSAEAQLEVTEVDELPVQLPDGLTNPQGGTINWRYRLWAVVLPGTGD